MSAEKEGTFPIQTFTAHVIMLYSNILVRKRQLYRKQFPLNLSQRPSLYFWNYLSIESVKHTELLTIPTLDLRAPPPRGVQKNKNFEFELALCIFPLE